MRTQRIRDPVHDVITFDETDKRDQLAWRIIDTPEFQRLRRIKQIGGAEFVYPAATHSRFAHSIGAYHQARRLLKIIEREFQLQRVQGRFAKDRARIAGLAALVHDIGHGPFSHTFEETASLIAKRRQSSHKSHQQWTADIVQERGTGVARVLGKDLSVEISQLVQARIATDMYHSIVSSSFDADRLDYIQRDRYMTGTGVGAIDLGWLLDNYRVEAIDSSQARYNHSFCFLYKAREAVEDFVLARSRLYSNVYLHKTSRGIERMLSAIFCGIAEAIDNGDRARIGLDKDDPLISFFSTGGETVANYLRLDDAAVWGALTKLRHPSDRRLRDMPARLLSRKHMMALDIVSLFPDDSEAQRRIDRAVRERFSRSMDVTVHRDEKFLTVYGEVRTDNELAHERIMVKLANGQLKEITELSGASIATFDQKRHFLRYYFLDEGEYQSAVRLAKQVFRRDG